MVPNSKKYSPKEVEKSLKIARDQLVKLAQTLPDIDEYASPYSCISTLIKSIDINLKELKESLEEANNSPISGMKNRAKSWCKIK